VQSLHQYCSTPPANLRPITSCDYFACLDEPWTPTDPEVPKALVDLTQSYQSIAPAGAQLVGEESVRIHPRPYIFLDPIFVFLPFIRSLWYTGEIVAFVDRDTHVVSMNHLNYTQYKVGGSNPPEDMTGWPQ
jgi:hypothetical protein